MLILIMIKTAAVAVSSLLKWNTPSRNVDTSLININIIQHVLSRFAIDTQTYLGTHIFLSIPLRFYDPPADHSFRSYG